MNVANSTIAECALATLKLNVAAGKADEIATALRSISRQTSKDDIDAHVRNIDHALEDLAVLLGYRVSKTSVSN